MLTATVTVNLDHEEPGYFQDLDYIDRHALQHVESIPNGAHLIIVVGARRWPTNSAVTWLKPHIDCASEACPNCTTAYVECADGTCYACDDLYAALGEPLYRPVPSADTEASR